MLPAHAGFTKRVGYRNYTFLIAKRLALPVGFAQNEKKKSLVGGVAQESDVTSTGTNLVES